MTLVASNGHQLHSPLGTPCDDGDDDGDDGGDDGEDGDDDGDDGDDDGDDGDDDGDDGEQETGKYVVSPLAHRRARHATVKSSNVFLPNHL